MNYPVIENLEKAAAILSNIPEQFVFTGGSTVILYARDDVYSEIRTTEDVDCVVEISTRKEYYQLADKLRQGGLSECERPNSPLCRWLYEELVIDIMPCGDEILGFSNRWYPDGIKNPLEHTLPSQRKIKVFSPLYLLATKIEAHIGRGKSFRFSKDVEDIIVLLDGQTTLELDYYSAQPNLKQYINQWFATNIDDLIEAAYISCPSRDIEREDLVIEVIEKIATPL
ncbi:MAG: nucleotidyl transferase AbiEii/AbiGii toxin family protein [Pleurocapsa sp. CRU_1_2]|nr:nucleotidyl transferase AbiEii/AbiGii toxin family protein [Pleurocapsa sp. CRU_1_2]